MAPWIVSKMITHRHYVEPFFGGGSVLLAKNPEGVSEVVNDLNEDLTNFWSVLADQTLFAQFQRKVEATPFCELLWNDARAIVEMKRASGRANWAWAFFVLCRQSLAGRMASFAPLSRTRTRRGMNEQASAWLTAVEGLTEIHARLKRVVILNRDAFDVIQQQDGVDTLFYCDPPFLHDSRQTTTEYGKFEMDGEQHRNLLHLLRQCRGKVLLSGYRSSLYDGMLQDWNRHDYEMPCNAASGKTKTRRIECLWANY